MVKLGASYSISSLEEKLIIKVECQTLKLKYISDLSL